MKTRVTVSNRKVSPPIIERFLRERHGLKRSETLTHGGGVDVDASKMTAEIEKSLSDEFGDIMVSKPW